MSGVALALVLAAALLHATWNRMLHGATDRLAAAAVGAVVGAVLLLPATITDPPVHAWPSALASGAAEAAYFAFLAAAYRRGELSFTYPVARGIAPFLITLGGALVLGQSLTAARVAGSLDARCRARDHLASRAGPRPGHRPGLRGADRH